MQIDLERHKRHLLLREIGGPGVQKLATTSVSIIGAGALGGPCAMYLAAAGVRHIELFDDDVVDTSNLQRQVQFLERDVGMSKVERLGRYLESMNEDIQITSRRTRVDSKTELSGDVLIDATDNYEARFALNAIAHQTSRPMVHGAAARWTGQVSVFTSGLQKGGPCYRCWVPSPPPETETCETVGVAGPVTGIVGTRLALEALKYITGAGPILIGKLWLFDGLSGDSRIVGLRKDSNCPHCAS